MRAAQDPNLAGQPPTRGEVARALRKMVLAMCVVGALNVAAIALQTVVLKQQATQARDQREGRALGTRTTCAVQSAVVDAAFQTIRAGAVLKPDRFRRNLERLGLPNTQTRRQAADLAAKAYASIITKAVEDATGRKGLVQPDGSLDCKRLSVATKATAPSMP